MALRMVALEARGVIFPRLACSAAAVAGSAFTLRERRGLGVEKPDAVIERGHVFEHGLCSNRFMSV